MQKHKAAIRREMRLLVDSRLNRSAAPRRRRGACSGKTAGVAVSAAVFFAAGEMVALIIACVECDALWLPDDEERWRAYLGSDNLDELPEVVFYCPACVEREFGDADEK
jgi:hypothetical protein